MFSFVQHGTGQTAIESDGKSEKGLKKSLHLTIEFPVEKRDGKMPSVSFPHDIHTEIEGIKCSLCHAEKGGSLSFKFKRTDEKPSMDLYHDNCIGCHSEKNRAETDAGPLTASCRSCHSRKIRKGINSEDDQKSEWRKISFDRSLHFIHQSSKLIKSSGNYEAADSEKNNCGACHHKYNKKAKKTYYAKGEEESCLYCHKEIERDGVRSFRRASHDSCVQCHISLKNKGTKAGPATCLQCHDEEEQKRIKRVENIPRLKRNQPDAAVIKGWMSGEKSKGYMNSVAFNHKSHEAESESCRSCHHDSLKKCVECHSAPGVSKGNFIRLEQAMHDFDSDRSCVGCHKRRVEKPDCAGCHYPFPKRPLKNSYCAVCHNITPDEALRESFEESGFAKKRIKDLVSGYIVKTEDKVPEKIVIGVLSDEYEVCEFPHKKVIRAIAKMVEKSRMAKAFHRDSESLCMGCHHNSPKALKPPKCSFCHGSSADIKNDRPSLKGAYHGQCISCHQKMEVEAVKATDCVKCHEKKRQSSLLLLK